MPQRLGKLRDREVVASVLQRARRIDCILIHRNVAQLQIVRQERPLVIVFRFSPGLHHVLQRGLRIESTSPECVRRSNHRRGRVPAHHIGHVIRCFPSRKLPALLRVVHTATGPYQMRAREKTAPATALCCDKYPSPRSCRTALSAASPPASAPCRQIPCSCPSSSLKTLGERNE